MEQDIRKIMRNDDEFPHRLKMIPDSPKVIYVKGKLPEKDKMTVGIIGARECSSYGERIAVEFGKVLAQNNIPLVSGMARGIDGISQRSAMENGGEVYAVLGSGVDVCYPKENRDIYERADKQGGIISIYPNGTSPIAKNFPPRNRIISGLADVLVVIEAGMKSGTMITVDMALEQGKDVYVVPGRIDDRLSEGCNYLISQGANMILSVKSFMKNIKAEYKTTDIHMDCTICEIGDEIWRIIYNELCDSPKTAGELWNALERKSVKEMEKMTVSNFMNILFELQMKEKIKKLGGFFLI